MFRILVADDEGIMLESIKNIIKSNFGSDCELVCVKTGRAVIEQADTFRPDIIFVDIQMPGLNGIQAIKEVRKFNTSIVFIIMTAYDKFTYAQEAVKLGVMEFLMKPVNKKKILDVCIKAMHQVEEARKKLSDDLKIKEKLEIVVPMLESGFIYNMLQEDFDASVNGYQQMLDIKHPYGFIIVLEFGETIEGGTMTNAIGVGVRINKYYPQVREIVKDYFDCVIGPVMGNRMILFVSFRQDKARYEQRVELITRTRNLIDKLENSVGMKCRGGIGTVKPLARIRDSYKEALKSLRESENHVVHITDIPAVVDYDGEYPMELENLYLQRGTKADLEGTLSCANEFFDWMLVHNGEVLDNIEIKILELIIRLERRSFEAGNLRYGFRYRESYLKELRHAGNVEELRHWFLEKTKEICENIKTSRKREYENVVSRVKAYINENYAKEISLDEISRLVDISPYYFSKLFKQEVGENFIEYVTRTRMNHAKHFLEDSNRYSIKEVCVMSGYSDPNYFSRIFKKYEGMTPSEYRER